jgi:hypothetical protein
VSASIYISTDVPDTDITVKLLDVDPSGRALNLSEGIARAQYRESFTDPTPLKPGQVYKLDVELYPVSNWLRRAIVCEWRFPAATSRRSLAISILGIRIPARRCESLTQRSFIAHDVRLQ